MDMEDQGTINERVYQIQNLEEKVQQFQSDAMTWKRGRCIVTQTVLSLCPYEPVQRQRMSAHYHINEAFTELERERTRIRC
jgi:hypothetical protein